MIGFKAKSLKILLRCSFCQPTATTRLASNGVIQSKPTNPQKPILNHCSRHAWRYKELARTTRNGMEIVEKIVDWRFQISDEFARDIKIA